MGDNRDQGGGPRENRELREQLQNIAENGFVDENKGRRVERPYQKQICNNRSGDGKFFYKEVLQMQ